MRRGEGPAAPHADTFDVVVTRKYEVPHYNALDAAMHLSDPTLNTQLPTLNFFQTPSHFRQSFENKMRETQICSCLTKIDRM